MSENTLDSVALVELLNEAAKLYEQFQVILARPEEEWPTMHAEHRRCNELRERVRRRAYRFVSLDAATVRAKFSQPIAGEAIRAFNVARGALIKTATMLQEYMAVADAKIVAGHQEDADKVCDFIVEFERDLCSAASRLLAADAALQAFRDAGGVAVEEVRKALTDLQASKGKKKAQAVLKRYVPTGTLDSLKAEDRSKVLADVKRFMTLRLVK
jgi:hypothetical protein